jgi:hypothetical protein
MRFLLLILLGSLACCRSNRSADPVSVGFEPVFTPGPPTLIYKTSKDYVNQVPVILSDDKTTIVSYPHPRDLKRGDKFLVPTTLQKGYLLDNRGIGKNVAFLKYTYEEYASFSTAPELSELNAAILDKDPLIELCHCGNRNSFQDIVTELNNAIQANEVPVKCKKL